MLEVSPRYGCETSIICSERMDGYTGDGILVWCWSFEQAGHGRGGGDWRQVACLPAKIVKWVDGDLLGGRLGTLYKDGEKEPITMRSTNNTSLIVSCDESTTIAFSVA